MKELSVATYAALLKKVKETLLLGQQKIEEARVQTYWNTGRYINQHVKINGGRAEYGKKVILKLSKDLKVGDDLLYRCSRFSALLPISASWRKLSWSHLRALCRVSDDRKRLELTEQASRNEWPSEVLETKIRNLLWDERVEALDGKPPSILPVPVLGPFYTYQIIRPESIHSHATEPLLDVGFSGTKKLTQFTSRKFPAGTVVTSVKDAKGRYSLRSVPLPRLLPRGEDKGEGALNAVPRTPYDLLYNYQAFVTRVIDGDTLKLEIDTGFDDQKHETIRLRGIDCPELNTPEGKAAKRFVERELAHCEFIILKSTRTPRKEKWGRYLGDVFLPARSLKASAVPIPINRSAAEIGAVPTTINEKKMKVGAAGTGAIGPECYTDDKTGKQVYLNNLLLEKGYAVRVRD